jgi:hypothetical protein
LSPDDAGRAIGAQGSDLRGLEDGRASFLMRDMVGLCRLYGVTDQSQRVMLLGLARRANHGEWWHPYRDVIPSWFARYLGLEQAACVVRSYEVEFVPGLLQTSEYARALLALGPAEAPQAAERRLDLRMRRQEILHQRQNFHLWAVIDEAALRRPVGSKAVMRAQLRWLLDACDVPAVTVQALPSALAGPSAPRRPFTLVRLPERQLDDVAYLEHQTTARYLDEPGDLDFCRQLMDYLAIEAWPPDPTRELLAAILRAI